MGFLDTLSRVAEAAMQRAEEANEQMERYMRWYEHLSDEELIEQLRRSSEGIQKAACMKLIKEGGYDSYKEDYAYLDDEELVRKYKWSSGIEKMACASLLEKRGYRRNR